jgi:sortase A
MIRLMRRGWDANMVLRRCALVCLAVGGIALSAYAYLLADASIYQKIQNRQFDSQVAMVSAERGPQNDSSTVSAGSAIGRIEIPRIGVSVIVLEGDDQITLRRGAGHIPGTALPGADGNVAIAAHRDTFFRPLRNIRKGDFIRLSSVESIYLYRVESTEVVEPGQTEVLNNTGQPILTLITCYPFFYIGAAPHRFIVRASRVSVRPRVNSAAGSTLTSRISHPLT